MLTQDQIDKIKALWQSTGKRTTAVIVGAIIATLTILTVSLTGEAPVAPEKPAPLPAGTGVDGGGEGDAVAVPDAGPDSNAALIEQPDGIGGEVYLTSPVWKGSQRLNAGQRYPSGGWHNAWDIGIWRGTKLYSPFAGKVVGSNDGVPNQPVGVMRSNSNWLLICYKLKDGREATLYYQHLSPGLKVKRGQTVKAGQYVANSGNTGRTTGDHLHLAAQWLRSGQKCSTMTQAQALSSRYDYLNRGNPPGMFAPSKLWTTYKPTATKAKPVVKLSNVRVGKKNSQVKRVQTGLRNRGAAYRKLNPSGATGYYGTQTKRMVQRYQRSLGFRGRDADGRIGCTSLKRLNKANGSKWAVKC